jgi:hypothetical protein
LEGREQKSPIRKEQFLPNSFDQIQNCLANTNAELDSIWERAHGHFVNILIEMIVWCIRQGLSPL